MLQIRKMLRPFSRRDNGGTSAVVQRANRAAAASFDTLRMSDGAGIGAGGEGWARPEYGRYMATSPSVYAAVRLRAEAVTRPPLRVYRVEGASPSPQPSPFKGEGAERRVPVEASHPAARLLERVNPWYTRADLWRATEIYLCLWGSAFWAIERARTASRSCGRCAPTAWR